MGDFRTARGERGIKGIFLAGTSNVINRRDKGDFAMVWDAGSRGISEGTIIFFGVNKEISRVGLRCFGVNRWNCFEIRFL